MHMADALLSPAVGGVMWVAAAGTLAYSATKLSKGDLEDLDNPKSISFDKKIPLMGVLGAFVFASQMINFTIPGTGSSGHIGGGILLASLLGPEAGFLTIASVLVIQCLFFADGGLLALGCNMINMGFFACFIGFPFIYKKILKNGFTPTKIMIASIISVVISLQLGAFGVVCETMLSGVTELPFSTFVILMQPIHLAIGLVEGILTGCVLIFIYNAKPELLIGYDGSSVKENVSVKKVALVLVVVAALIERRYCMPYLKNYRLLISHSWHYESQYSTIVTWLNNTSYFKWSNHSVSADRPLNTKTNQQLREELSQQIRGCNAVIVVAGMYTLYSEWINYEIDEALRMKKPIIGIKPWGNQRIPEKIQQNATVLVGWNSSSLVSAVRNYAL